MKSPSVCQLLHVLASEFVGWFVGWFVGGCVGSVVGCFVGCFVGCMLVVVLAGPVVEAATEPLSPTIDMTVPTMVNMKKSSLVLRKFRDKCIKVRRSSGVIKHKCGVIKFPGKDRAG